MLAPTFAEPVAEGRKLSETWGGTTGSAKPWGGTTGTNVNACKFKSLATLFPSAPNAIITEDQPTTWDTLDQTLTDATVSFGTYTRRLTDTSILKQAAAQSTATGKANTVGYYYYAYDDGQWKKVVGSADPSKGTANTVLIQESPGSSYGEEQYNFRGLSGPDTAIFTAETSTHTVFTDRPISSYGMREEISKKDLIFGAASTCSRRGGGQNNDGDIDADSDDIFVWATYSYPAFAFEVDKEIGGRYVIMGDTDYDDDNNEITFVYGNQPQTTPLSGQSPITITLGADSVTATCTASLIWAEDNPSNAAHPEKCLIGTVDASLALLDDPDASHNIKQGCQSGATMSCQVSLASSINPTIDSTPYDVETSVAVLEFVKLTENTKAFPYANFESFVDDAPQSGGYVASSWYLPNSDDDADPYTVLGVQSSVSTFICPTDAYNAESVPCVTGGGPIADGLGVTTADLLANWPSTNLSYSSVYVSMIAQVAFEGDFTGRKSNGIDHDDNGITITNGDSVTDNGAIKTAQAQLVTIESELITTYAAVDSSKATFDLAADAYIAAAAVLVEANNALSQCNLSTPGDCTSEVAANAVATTNLATTVVNTDAAQSALDTATTAAVDKYGERVTQIAAIEALRQGSNTARRLVGQNKPVLKKTVIIGQHYGSHRSM